jgi:hypothetical protein
LRLFKASIDIISTKEKIVHGPIQNNQVFFIPNKHALINRLHVYTTPLSVKLGIHVLRLLVGVAVSSGFILAGIVVVTFLELRHMICFSQIQND